MQLGLLCDDTALGTRLFSLLLTCGGGWVAAPTTTTSTTATTTTNALECNVDQFLSVMSVLVLGDAGERADVAFQVRDSSNTHDFSINLTYARLFIVVAVSSQFLAYNHRRCRFCTRDATNADDDDDDVDATSVAPQLLVAVHDGECAIEFDDVLRLVRSMSRALAPIGLDVDDATQRAIALHALLREDGARGERDGVITRYGKNEYIRTAC